jgi:hypothetical protein
VQINLHFIDYDKNMGMHTPGKEPGLAAKLCELLNKFAYTYE